MNLKMITNSWLSLSSIVIIIITSTGEREFEYVEAHYPLICETMLQWYEIIGIYPSYSCTIAEVKEVIVQEYFLMENLQRNSRER